MVQGSPDHAFNKPLTTPASASFSLGGMDLAVGIDVGFSAKRASSGAVIIDRASKTFAPGSAPRVGGLHEVVQFVVAEIDRLKPSSLVSAVDGPFAGAMPPRKARSIERLFMSGPFAAAPPNGGSKLRLMPAPTAESSEFLKATRLAVDALATLGQIELKVAGCSVIGDVIEIFPTLFLSALLRPHAYSGKRGEHTDDLWLKLIGSSALNGVVTTSAVLAPYAALSAKIESAPHNERHDLRAAAISAIAADMFAAFPPAPNSLASTSYIAHAVEGGFVLPPRALFDAQFLHMLEEHWVDSKNLDLVWL